MSLLYNQEYYLIFPQFVLLVRAGCSQLRQCSTLLHQAGSEQAENQVSEGFSSLEFVLQQTFYPVMAKVKKLVQPA